MNGNMMQPTNGQNLPEFTPEQMVGVLLEYKQLMQQMASALAATNKQIEQLKKQMEQITPITGAQERAISEQIKRRAEELRGLYKLSPKSATAIANAIRKDIKQAGGVRAIRELPRIEYAVYIQRIALWDEYAIMKGIRKADLKTDRGKDL